MERGVYLIVGVYWNKYGNWNSDSCQNTLILGCAAYFINDSGGCVLALVIKKSKMELLACFEFFQSVCIF